MPYDKTLASPPGMFTSLEEIQGNMEEQKRLDLNNEEVWSKVCLSAERTTEARGYYEGKVIFKYVQMMLMASNEPLMDCGPLLDCLRKKTSYLFYRHL